jgi:hypothetical protein
MPVADAGREGEREGKEEVKQKGICERARTGQDKT